MCVRKWLVIGSIVAVAVVANPRTASADCDLDPVCRLELRRLSRCAAVTAASEHRFEQVRERKSTTARRLPATGARAVFGFEVDFGLFAELLRELAGDQQPASISRARATSRTLDRQRDRRRSGWRHAWRRRSVPTSWAESD